MELSATLRKALRNPRQTARTVRALARGQYYKTKFRLLGRRVVIGRWFMVEGPLDIRGPGTVIFGDRCSVWSSPLMPTTPWTHGPEAVICFGDRVRLTGTRLSATHRIEVGDWSGLSDCRISDSDFHDLEVYDRPRYNTEGTPRPVVIGRNVWVAAGAVILKGVRIGDHSVIGAASVVATSVPENTVVFGNQARVVWRLNGPRPAALDAAVPPAPIAPTAPLSAPITAPAAPQRTNGANNSAAASPAVLA